MHGMAGTCAHHRAGRIPTGHLPTLRRLPTTPDDSRRRETFMRRTAGPGADWDAFEAALLRAADELHADSCIGDATWAVLAGHYDDAQLIELIMLVGRYHLVARSEEHT